MFRPISWLFLGGNWYWGQGLLVELTLSARLDQGWYRPARAGGQISSRWNHFSGTVRCGNVGPSQRHRHWWCNPARWCHTSAMNAALKPAMVESVRPSSTKSPLGWKPQEVGSPSVSSDVLRSLLQGGRCVLSSGRAIRSPQQFLHDLITGFVLFWCHHLPLKNSDTRTAKCDPATHVSWPCFLSCLQNLFFNQLSANHINAIHLKRISRPQRFYRQTSATRSSHDFLSFDDCPVASCCKLSLEEYQAAEEEWTGRQYHDSGGCSMHTWIYSVYRAYVINKSTLNSWPDDINLVEPKIRDQAVLSAGINETRVRMRLDQTSPFPRSTLIIGKKFGKYPLVN